MVFLPINIYYKMNKVYIFLVVIFLFFTHKSNAQYVAIPDSNFASYLATVLSSPAIIGNQLDTTHTQVVNLTTMNCQGNLISDLEGIQYFSNLSSLNCNNNWLINLPALPPSLTFLDCSRNNLTTLPVLPVFLTSLFCQQNQLATLPPLPTSLIDLTCFNNQLVSLPVLPVSLLYLNCPTNQLSALPTLPTSLSYLWCGGNQLTSLPLLPGSLADLRCNDNQLTALPVLPGSLTVLRCHGNQLASLPALPGTITELICSSNQLTSLPALPVSLTRLMCQVNPLNTLPTMPGSLQYLYCSSNQLSALPALPGTLTVLNCGINQLTTLPSLPGSLTDLSCSYNQLISLPSLPDSLTYLSCMNNQLTTLPTLPESLTSLYCSYNQLSSLPSLPNILSRLDCSDNPLLTCLPELKTITSWLDFENTSVQCLPNFGNVNNSYPSLSSLPLCDIFNTNNCNFYYNISGRGYFDNNNNCNNDPAENGISNIKVNLYQNSNLILQGLTTQGGLYALKTLPGTFNYSIDTVGMPFIVSCPPSGSHTSIISSVDSTDIGNDFGIECKPGFDVAAISIANYCGRFFPADTAFINVRAGDLSNFYNLNCASGTSGSVTITFSGPVQFAGNSPGSIIPTVAANTLTYNIVDFGLSSSIKFKMVTDTTAQAGQPVCFDVNVTPVTGDNNVSNNQRNHCFTVVNSYDPNDKQVYPNGNIQVGTKWLTYTIRFQNTGTAPAENITITDTLDGNLQIPTFSYLGSSHQPYTQVLGNVVKFIFANINLPDSTNDEPNSYGYVQYRIKLKDNLPIGSSIENTAAIFFDFNQPVITNTTLNSLVLPTAIPEYFSPEVNIFPNPANNIIRINSSSLIEAIKIYDIQGRCVFSKKVDTDEMYLDVSVISSGAYQVIIDEGTERVIRKKLIISR
jgi:uncharacterized repeat protein (TIGR01451 family)